MSEFIQGYDRATVLDLSLIAGGSLDFAFEFCVANGISLTDSVDLGKDYSLSHVGKIDEVLATRIAQEKIRPATEASADDMAACPYGGIGLMAVDVDFEVS